MADIPAILRHFPPTDYIAAYGSGVMKQQGYDAKTQPMLDLLFGVRDVGGWHALNLVANPKDYSGLARIGGSRIVSLIQEKGAGVYYNTLVECEGRMIKYGVVSVPSLLDDLLSWRSLYVSGRMHKPIVTLKSEHHIEDAIVQNRRSALDASILMLPNRFSMTDLLMTICGLSYAGDWRMIFGENPNKVKNIVAGQRAALEAIYDPLLQVREAEGVLVRKEDTIQMAEDPKVRDRLATQLPAAVLAGLEEKFGEFAVRFPEPNQIRAVIAGIVRGSSFSQAFKGGLSAGVRKTVVYSAAKIGKMFAK